MARKPACKDCKAEGITTRRPSPHPGPRCATHHRQARNSRREAAWERHLRETYNITAEDYWSLYEQQGGTCYICQRARGTGRKRLSVDHDHSCCPGRESCGECVRGLLCATDNRWLGHIRDDPECARRAAEYLENRGVQTKH